MKNYKESTMLILDEIEWAIEKLEDETISLDEIYDDFTDAVSKQQLEACLVDPAMDEDDIIMCKQMLKHFYNYELIQN